ncbi:putative pectinesterase 53-like isoform X1 [Hibiscus syriacus]|uniref:Pectinesterase 53-like isoform X1 n=1 Tax=Hibiscus syriacus TaxID=106335 RepID=A0A6A2Z8W9_HIBSY|nr:uncharacterized protein LOC120149623 [Hibiscus syriacus]KAE8687859.1 putative pectinesterase 53-like isoform X1 [Hibiscus syriacus]
MGRGTRWLKGLFGIKNSKDYSNSDDRKERKRCSIGHSRRDSSGGLCRYTTMIPSNISPAETWLRSYSGETEKEQNMHAIAVAAATAAAADAAVAAAKAAVAVVRLTSQGRGAMFGGHETRAAVKIQTVFRGYLARSALRALKGLVKIQALVRGYLVRKQATIMPRKPGGLVNREANRFGIRERKSLERLFTFDTANDIDESSKIVEVDSGRPKSRSCRNNASESGSHNDQPLHRTYSSPFLCRVPAPRVSIQESRHFQHSDCVITGYECRFSTAQNTPRIISCCGPNASVAAPKSVCAADNWFRHYGNCPNYMVKTQSFKAKLRSQSAPKQRPEPGPKKRLSLD